MTLPIAIQKLQPSDEEKGTLGPLEVTKAMMGLKISEMK